jgi:putative transposase
MSRKVIAETMLWLFFFKRMKTEWQYKNNYNNFSEAEMSIFKRLETWYNRNRRQSALNYKTINEF